MTVMNELEGIASSALEDATGLPFAAYSDSELHDIEQQKIFTNDWVFACNTAELTKNGDYYAFDIGDEPVIVIRGDGDTIRALSNVCRHRGTLLNDQGSGNKSRMVCPYHAWTYTTEGKLSGVPHTGNITVDKSEHCLPEFKLEVWNNLVFVNLSGDAESLATRYQGMQKYLKPYKLDTFTEGSADGIEVWQSNWKLAMENAMESYHLFRVHKPTLETVTPTKDAFYIEGHAPWTITAGKMKNIGLDGLTGKLLGAFMDKQRLSHYLLISLPPSFVGILNYDSFGYLSVHPKKADECIIRAGYISPQKGKASKSESEFTAAFFAEDKAICERNQRAMKSRFGKPGKLVELERVVVDFHHYLANRLYDTPVGPVFTGPQAEDFSNG